MMTEVYELAIFDVDRDDWISVGVFPSFAEVARVGEEILKSNPCRFIDWEFTNHPFCPTIDLDNL